MPAPHRPDAPAAVLRELLGRGQPLERVLPAFTSSPAALLRLARKGRLVPGADADLAVLNESGAPAEVTSTSCVPLYTQRERRASFGSGAGQCGGLPSGSRK